MGVRCARRTLRKLRSSKWALTTAGIDAENGRWQAELQSLQAVD